MGKFYFLYNDYRMNVLFDLNSRVRIASLKNSKNIILIKLSDISNFVNLNYGKKQLLLIEESSIPASTHNFNFNDLSKYKKFMDIFNYKVLIFEDLHHYTFKCYQNLLDNLLKYNIYYFISFYDCLEYNYIKKILHSWHGDEILTHYFDSNIFKDYKLEKEYDILLYGDTVQEAYPFRNRLSKLIRSDLFKKFKIKIINRNNYLINKNDIDDVIKHRHELAKIINSSYLSIATCSKYDYFVCKYLEIAGSKSVVVGNIETLGKKIFEDNFIELNPTMTDQEIFNVIDKALSNKENLKKIADIMYNKVHDYYTIEKHYKKNLDLKVNSIIQKINLKK